MAVIAFDTRTALLVGGFVYLIMPLAVWVILHARHDRLTLFCWNAGSLLAGAGYCLIALRGAAPDWLSIGVANALNFGSYALRGLALQRESGAARIDRVSLWWPLPATVLFCISWAVDPRLRLLVNASVHTLASLWLAALALRLAQQQHSRSAQLLGWAYGLFGVGAGVRLLGLLSGYGATNPMSSSPDFLAWIGLGLVAGLYSNVGFLGIVVESARQRETRQAADLARQQLLREQAEEHSLHLTQQLGREEEVLRLLAHEVRQPLHNAMAVLQGARAGLRQARDPDTVTERIERAQLVIHQIVGTLDNTLAATALLASQHPVARHDADIDMLVSMSIADLPLAAQSRIQVARHTSTRTASLDPSLMRLALRNLLSNACTYAGPDSPVHLSLSDRDDPLALVIEVSDQGPGIEPPMRGQLFEAGTRGKHGLPGHGLGLYVVRRVMELHGGTVRWEPNRPSGSVFRLVIPQGRD
jgi:signal transduction histidine kinase